MSEEEQKEIRFVDSFFKTDKSQKIIYIKESDLDVLSFSQRKSLKKLQKKFKYIIQFELF